MAAIFMKPHILVVDDDAITSKVLRYLLEDAGYRTTTLHDPRMIDAVLQEQSVDLVLLDVMLPYVDGFTLCAALQRDHPNIPIIFLSARVTVQDKVAGLNQGADDYIEKPFQPAELLVRIKAVLHRYRRLDHGRDSTIVRVGEASLNIGRLQFSVGTRQPVLLTPTEMRILEHLMRNANTVIPRQSLIERLGRQHSPGVSNRIDVYVRRLRRKIERDPDDPTYIHTVRGVGYIFRDTGAETTSVVG